MTGRRDRLGCFRQLPDVIEDRQQIDIGEGEVIAGEIARSGDRLVENAQLFANRRGFDVSFAPFKERPGANIKTLTAQVRD